MPQDSTDSLAKMVKNGGLEVFAPKTRATKVRHLEMKFLFAINCMERASSSEQEEARFLFAHNAACAFVETALLLRGYRLACQGDLDTVLEAMPLVLGEGFDEFTSYFSSCVQKRERDEFDLYSSAPDVTPDEADELLNLVMEFKKLMLGWLEENGWWDAVRQ